MDRQRIGLIGLGLMGSALAERLLGASYEVFGHDIDSARCEALESIGGSVAADRFEDPGGLRCFGQRESIGGRMGCQATQQLRHRDRREVEHRLREVRSGQRFEDARRFSRMGGDETRSEPGFKLHGRPLR